MRTSHWSLKMKERISSRMFTFEQPPSRVRFGGPRELTRRGG
jgi:hypothetical protein